MTARYWREWQIIQYAFAGALIVREQRGAVNCPFCRMEHANPGNDAAGFPINFALHEALEERQQLPLQPSGLPQVTVCYLAFSRNA